MQTFWKGRDEWHSSPRWFILIHDWERGWLKVGFDWFDVPVMVPHALHLSAGEESNTNEASLHNFSS